MPDQDLSNRAPVLSIRWDGAAVGITGAELVEKLDKGSPRIFVGGGEGHRPDATASSIEIMPYMMQPGDHKIVAEVIGRYLRHPGHFEDPPVYTGQAANVAGIWDASINYVRGVGQQQFVLKQDGDSLTGEQRGEVFQAALHGKVEGNQVTLRSMMRPGNYYLPYVFTGTVSGSTFLGDVAMGEYGNATFSATRV
jgi:hypothetical protein